MSNLPVAVVGNGRTSLAILEILTVLNREVVGQFVEKDYIEKSSTLELEAWELNQLFERHSPDSCEVFVAIGYQELNHHRKRVSDLVESRGFKLATLVSPLASISTSAYVGSGCFVGPFVEIQPEARVGKGSFIWASSIVGHGSDVGECAWVSALSAIGGDARIGRMSFLGLGAVVSHNVQIGASCFVGASSLTAKDLEDGSALLSPSSTVFRGAARRVLQLMDFER